MRIVIFISISILCSCTAKEHKQRKEYKYILRFMKTAGLTSAPADEAPAIIPAVSDSAAYIHAYLFFCISQKHYKHEFAKSGTIAGRPISFRLLNDSSKDIAPTVTFLNKNILEKAIEREVSRN